MRRTAMARLVGLVSGIDANRKVVMAPIILLLLLGACGDSGSSDATERGTGESSTSLEEGSDTVADTESDLDLGSITAILSSVNSITYIGLQEGNEMNAWDGTGLEVDVVESTSTAATQALAAGEAEVVAMGATNIGTALAKDFPGKLIAPVSLRNSQLVVVRSDHPAETIEDLEGATWGISGHGSAGHFSTETIIETMGWDEGAYEIVALGGIEEMTAAIRRGSIDAFAWSGGVSFELEEEGVVRILTPVAPLVPPYVSTGWMATDSIIEENPQGLCALLTGYYSTITTFQEDPDLVRDIMVNAWEQDPDGVDQAIEHELEHLSSDGDVPAENLQGWADATIFVDEEVDTFDPEPVYVPWKDLCQS